MSRLNGNWLECMWRGRTARKRARLKAKAAVGCAVGCAGTSCQPPPQPQQQNKSLSTLNPQLSTIKP